MFTQGCFIRKNSEYLRKSLDLIGKRNLCNIHDGILITHSDRHYSLLDCNEIIEIMLDDGFIYCGTNEELFLAIAALRDDSDRLQWFIHDDSDWNDEPNIFWYKCESESINDDMALNLMCNDCRKATVEELIEHFKNKL